MYLHSTVLCFDHVIDHMMLQGWLYSFICSQHDFDSLKTHGFGDSSISTTMKPKEELTATSKPSSNVLCPHCSLQLSVDSLEEVEYNLSMIYRSINLMVEDEYNDGEFYLASGNHLLKYIQGKPVQHVLGPSFDTDFRQFFLSLDFDASFIPIPGLVQLTETTFLISDYRSTCIYHYDVARPFITEFIGNCSIYRSTTGLQPGEELPANITFLYNPLKIVMIKSKNYLIVLDQGHHPLYRYNFENETVRLLGDDLYRSLPNCKDILPTRDESAIYAAHSYGLSRVDLSTLKVTLITGEVYSGPDNAPDIVFSPGSFDTAVIGYIETIRWLIPDRLMVTIGTGLNEELIFIDLDEKEIYATCLGMLVLFYFRFYSPFLFLT